MGIGWDEHRLHILRTDAYCHDHSRVWPSSRPEPESTSQNSDLLSPESHLPWQWASRNSKQIPAHYEEYVNVKKNRFFPKQTIFPIFLNEC